MARVIYDLLIKGGRVIDPANNFDDMLDIAIIGGKISAVAKDIPPEESHQLIEAGDKIVTPGLIDLHCHVYDVMQSCVAPDDAGVKQGVTTVVDAGSAGQAIFDGFPKYVIPSYRTTVFCFLHLSSVGLSVVPELENWNEVDIDATTATIESNRDIIRGIKLRLAGTVVASAGLEPVRIAQRIAKKFNLPIMVHIGDPDRKVSPTLTQECLAIMESGDILSHVYTDNPGGILHSDGSVLTELREAKDRGIVLDTAQGRFSLSYEVARKCMDQGIYPTTISTDLNPVSLFGPVYGLTVAMSRFLALGMSLKQVIEMTTINPARALNIGKSKGSLSPGTDADISILDVLSGVWNLGDSRQRIIKADKLISPIITVKAGNIIPAQPVSQPQTSD